jgi:hypothetical protein
MNNFALLSWPVSDLPSGRSMWLCHVLLSLPLDSRHSYLTAVITHSYRNREYAHAQTLELHVRISGILHSGSLVFRWNDVSRRATPGLLQGCASVHAFSTDLRAFAEPPTPRGSYCTRRHRQSTIEPLRTHRRRRFRWGAWSVKASVRTPLLPTRQVSR